MNKSQAKQSPIYQNVMEILVAQEVKKQLRQLPSSLVSYIDSVEVCTFALNRLPPLYASSEQGKKQQEKRGKEQYDEQIATAVRQALAAIQRDPLRVSKPIVPQLEGDYNTACVALKNLEELLRSRELIDVAEINWSNLVTVVKRALYKVTKENIMQQRRDDLRSSYSRWGKTRNQ